MSLPLYSTHKSHKKSFKYLVKCKIRILISLHLDSNGLNLLNKSLQTQQKDLMKKIKVLIIGKSNVGKSSFINYITNKKNSLVSKNFIQHAYQRIMNLKIKI